jgi:hypothetical protein
MIIPNLRGIVGLQYAEKASGDTTRDTETKSNDPDLVLPVGANGIYKLDGLIYCTSTGGNSQLGLSVVAPVGSTGYWLFDSTVTGATGYTSSVNRGRRTLGFHASGVLIAASNAAYPIKGVVRVAGTAGDVAVSWGRNVGAAAFPCVLQQYSWMTLERVADL